MDRDDVAVVGGHPVFQVQRCMLYTHTHTQAHTHTHTHTHPHTHTHTQLQSLSVSDTECIFSLGRDACLHLPRSAHWGAAGIKDSVQVDVLFIHPLPPPSPPSVSECDAIRSLQMKTRLI